VTDLVIRSLAAGEEHLFEQFPGPSLVGPAVFGRGYRALAKANEYRPEWTWVALRGDQVVARAAWWGGTADDTPGCLHWFDLAEPAAGAALLATAPLRCEYYLPLPTGWRGQPATRAAAQVRIDAATAAGMRPLVERYQYRWTPADGLPPRPRRLRYEPEPDDAVILDALRRINHGTLDAHARASIASVGIDATAEDDLKTLHWFPSPRDWWRVAYTAGGELVGLSIPARNYADPVVGLIGVVPGQRGHGYGYDLLVECTHLLVAAGADRVVAATDQTNTPMAAAFARAGYPIERELVFLH
jgi:RimJ/RimL family protein N-acetyltransferase